MVIKIEINGEKYCVNIHREDGVTKMYETNDYGEAQAYAKFLQNLFDTSGR